MKKILIFIAALSIVSCVSIPKETVALSETLGKDLKILHTSHRNAVSIYYQKIKENIDTFINEVYTPFVINFVLKKELKSFKSGKGKSIFTSLNSAAKKASESASKKATQDMQDFLEAANRQIQKKKSELLSPIVSQETELLLSIDKSYQNTQYANATVTAYLQSIRKVKQTQRQALSMIGLKGADSIVTQKLISLSDGVKAALEKGKEIDTKSDDALQKIQAITEQIKALTNKNK